MSNSRHLTLATRSALLMTAGLGLIAMPFVLAMGTAALVSGVLIGAVMVALALAGTDAGGRGTLSATAQAEYDRGIAVGLVLAAAAFGIAGEAQAAVLFGIAGLATVLVTTVTRYSARPA